MHTLAAQAQAHLNAQQAQQAQQVTAITAQHIQALLANTSVTFAQVMYSTSVTVAKKHSASVSITKIVNANVQLFNNISSFTNVYKNAVQKSASKIASNCTSNVQNFKTQQAFYTHNNAQCYSIVQHKTNNTLYLFSIYNNAKSVYFINNKIATKQQVAQYLTASNAKKLLSNSTTVHNVANNVTHNVVTRTIKLSNLISITANKQTITTL